MVLAEKRQRFFAAETAALTGVHEITAVKGEKMYVFIIHGADIDRLFTMQFRTRDLKFVFCQYHHSLFLHCSRRKGGWQEKQGLLQEERVITQ